jgi:ribosome-binding protein aMBF1 (putative translation factor)
VTSSFADTLRASRERAGLSREALAVEITRSAYTIANYEKGRVNPSRPIRVRLAHLLNEPALLDAPTDKEQP